MSDEEEDTSIEIREYNLVWTIKNFSKLSKILTSPQFPPPAAKDDLEWSMDLYANGTNEKSDEVALFLVLESNSSGVFIVPTKFKVGIVNTKGERICFLDSHKTFITDDELWGKHKFIKRDILLNEKYDLFTNDTLVIFCQVFATVDRYRDLRRPLIETEEYRSLLRNKDLTDVIIVVDGREFPAHKEILAAHSPVFKAMFECNMEESKTNRVEIPDVDEYIMEELINYMYRGAINNLDDIAQIIVQTAHKYDMDDIQSVCEKSISETITFNNVFELLIFSDMFHLTKLKDEIKKFILNCPGAVGNKPEFKSMILKNPQLGVELFRALSNNIGFSGVS